MKRFKQFLIWRLKERAGKKPLKLPCSPHTGKATGVNDVAHFVSYEEALTASVKYDAGVAFVLTENDPLFLLDIDNCLTPEYQWNDTALKLCGDFAGAYMERSISGKGLHIIAECDQLMLHSCKYDAEGLEFYTKKRFIALSEDESMGDSASNHTPAAQGLIASYFQPTAAVVGGDWTTEPVAEYTFTGDLIAAACKTKGANAIFGGGASFADLWTRNVKVLEVAYPDNYSDIPREFDFSTADAALAQHLAFWTGKNCEHMAELMKQSGLVRDKYDRDDYIRMTVLNAVSVCKSVFTAGHKPSKPKAYKKHGAIIRDSVLQYLSPEAQVKHFSGCVYVADINKVITTEGTALAPAQFKAMYGGHVFAIDNIADKETRDAWEAFTNSQAVDWPKVYSTSFRPDMPAGNIFEESGLPMVNSYVPIRTPCVKGDVTPFLLHLKKLLPQKMDRDILLAYMACIVQYKGHKIPWCVLIQGVKGNGKSLITSVLMEAVGRRYTHKPRADEIDTKFNSWMEGNILIGVEDIYVPSKREAVMEILKPMITENFQSLEGKNINQESRRVCCNFILNSNHKDAIRQSEDERRYCVFYTAQQLKSDMHRDGMVGEYFPKLYNWLKNEGYAYVTEFLESYAIPDELNPLVFQSTAPATSSTAEAIVASVGQLESLVLEAVDSEVPGFCGGFISSVAMDRLFEQYRVGNRMAKNKRKPFLEALGYVCHPALTRGRLNAVTVIDGCKPILYVHAGHIMAGLTSPAQVHKAYEATQNDGDNADAVFAGVMQLKQGKK